MSGIRGRQVTARALAAVALAVGAALVVPAGMAAAATTTSMDLSVTTASGSCASAGANAVACTAQPTELQATVAIVDTVSVTFDTTGRPVAAPEPEDNPDVLSAPHCSATSLFAQRCTWSIPAGLHSKASASQLLNGTYTVTACHQSGSSCTSDPTYAPSTFSVSVAPAAPAGVKAVASGGVVTVSWSADSAPDLAGYAVYRAAGTSRDDDLVWDCTDNGAPLARAPACGSHLSTTDSPGKGSWTYAVVALRYGSSPTGADPVASPASTVAIAVTSRPTTGTTTTTTTTVPGRTTTPGGSTTTATLGGVGGKSGTSGGAGGTGSTSSATFPLPPVQVATGTPTVPAASPPPDPAQLSAPSTIPPAFTETIPYKHTSSDAAVAAGQDLGSGSGTSVTGIGLVAGALLALALAAQLWFVRQESRRVGAHSRRP